MIDRLKGLPGLCLFWLLSRALMLLVALRPSFLSALPATTGDVTLYDHWSKLIAGGAFPAESRWQYPSLAGLVMVLPRLLPGGYLHAFMAIAVIMDLCILALLVRGGDRLGGAWTWAGGLALLGGTAFLRYDLFVTAAAVTALLALSRERLFGLLAAAGAMLKVWPLLLMLALPRDRRLLRGGVAFGLTVVATLVGGSLLRNQFGFLRNQSSRGLEIEALAATPFQIGRLFGWHGRSVYRYGNYQFAAHGMDTIGTLCEAGTVLGLLLVAFLAWRRRPQTWTPAFGCDVALTAVLVSMVTSRVLSPQYMIWLIGLSAACMAFRGSQLRPAIVLTLVATGLSQVLYPYCFPDLYDRQTHVLPILLVSGRNLLLLVATGLAIVALWRWPASADTVEEPGRTADTQETQADLKPV